MGSGVFLTNKFQIKNLLLFPILLICSIILKVDAQNLRFSQFQNVPLELNPALTGSKDKGRIIANYHHQQGRILRGGGYQSVFFSYDDTKALKNGDKIGYGGMTSFEFDEENGDECHSLLVLKNIMVLL